MDDQSWQFEDMRAGLLNAIEALNTNIRDAAQTHPPAAARDRGDDGIARWNAERLRTIGALEAAKKVILARLGPTTT